MFQQSEKLEALPGDTGLPLMFPAVPSDRLPAAHDPQQVLPAHYAHQGAVFQFQADREILVLQHEAGGLFQGAFGRR